jgi:hypothetical protein
MSGNVVVALFILFTLLTSNTTAQTPSVVSVTPTQNAQNVIYWENISVTFNTDMNEATINNSSFLVNSQYSGLLTGYITYDELSKTVTFYNDSVFIQGELVTVVLTRDIQSLSGDSLANAYTWQFTVGVWPKTGQIFVENSTFSTAISPTIIRTADFDKDYFPDLVVYTADADLITVYLNQGAGNFLLYTDISTGGSVRSVEPADVNHDGYIDLVVAAHDQYQIRTYINSGLGSFSVMISTDLEKAPHRLAVNDLNGDGIPDVVAVNLFGYGSYECTVLFGGGDGTFETDTTYNVDYSLDLAGIFDLDNDNDLDLLLGNGRGGQMHFLINDGSGRFEQLGGISIGGNAVDLAPFDIDADGNIDFATVQNETYEVEIYHNQGDGTFVRDTAVFIGTGLTGLITGDWDNDQDLDLSCMATDDNQLITFYQNSAEISFTRADYTNANPRGLTAGDFDNDGDLDIVVTNFNDNSFTLFLNSDCGTEDDDGDTVGDNCDNCVALYNPDQHENDCDGIADICDDDDDNDGIPDIDDNCIYVANTDQADADGDGRGNACSIMCGDLNNDKLVNILDISKYICYLYSACAPPMYVGTMDVNASGSDNILDITYLIAYLYQGGPDLNCPSLDRLNNAGVVINHCSTD